MIDFGIVPESLSLVAHTPRMATTRARRHQMTLKWKG